MQLNVLPFQKFHDNKAKIFKIALRTSQCYLSLLPGLSESNLRIRQYHSTEYNQIQMTTLPAAWRNS